MNDLDDRLASLRHHPQPDGAGVGAIRRRAEHRARRRRTVVASVAAVALVVGVAGVFALDREGTQRVDSGPASHPSDLADPAPRLEASPGSDLTDGQEVAIVAEGLPPHATFALQQCRADGVCDELTWPAILSDGDGRLQATTTARPAIYTYEGPVDCTRSACTVALRSPEGTVVAEAPLTFAAGVLAPRPTLMLEPGGPYVDDQEVEVRGSGFPPGIDVGPQLGQCPADLDTAVAERCSRPAAFRSVVVAADGTFTATVRLSDSLIFTGSCVTGPGCVLGWVIPHGPTVVAVPLAFTG